MTTKAVKLTMTITQRLAVDGLLSQQRGSVGELEIFLDIMRKVKVPEDLQAKFVTPIEGLPGQIRVSAAADLCEPTEIALEKAERQRLLRLLREWPTFSIPDMAWVLPLRKQLESMEQ